MQRASDFKVHLPITVLSTAILHAEAHFKFLPEKLTSTLIKRQRKVRAFDQIAAEMYVIRTLPGEVNGMVRRLYPVRRLGL